MPQDALTQRLFGDLSRSVLLQTIYSDQKGSRLRQLVFMTVPRAGYEPGLCESGYVWVEFEPVDRPPPPGDTDIPVLPWLARTSPFYIIVDRESFIRGEWVSPAERVPTEETCAAIDPRSTHHVGARSITGLRKGLQAMGELIATAKTMQVTALRDCRAFDRNGTVSSMATLCVEAIAALDASHIDYVDECPPKDGFDTCLGISFNEKASITLEFRPGEAAPGRVGYWQWPPRIVY